MFNKKYFNSLLMVSSIIVPTIFSFPAQSGSINREKEDKAWNNITRKAEEQIRQAAVEIKEQERAATKELDTEIEKHRASIEQNFQERMEKARVLKSQRQEKQQKIEARLKEIDAELKDQLKPLQESISNKTPEFNKLTEKYNLRKQELYKSKYDFMQSSYARLWDGMDSQDLGFKISLEQDKINAIRKELMEKDEKEMEIIEKKHNDKYREEISKLHQDNRDAEIEYNKASEGLWENKSSKEEQRISDLNRKVNETRVPYRMQIEELLWDAQLKLIEETPIKATTDNNNKSEK